MKRMIVTIGAALILPVAAIAAQPAPPAPLTKADTDRIIPVRVGQVLTVELRQAAGTGSSWRMVPAKGLVAIGAPIVAPVRRDGPPVPGGPEIHRFQVRVTAMGELALTFVNMRTFGGPDQRGETATFVVEAR